ncbi:MAG TPA: thioredoxin family protein [Chitinophagaceae bacterium]|nr:thioredoxin family protein [Chitinophagaceae bacterium]
MICRITCCLILTLSGLNARGQDSLYHTSWDGEGHKVLTGIITEPMLANDPSFSWFYQGVNDYIPDSKLVRYIGEYRDSFDLVVFAGTWCPDTWHLLPAFYRTMISAGFPLDRIRLYGVDTSKKTLGDETERYHITQVPTFILLYHGREAGRIVESAKGSIEADLASLIYNMLRGDYQKPKL